MENERRTIMRAIFRQGLAAAKRDGDAERARLYQECLDRARQPFYVRLYDAFLVWMKAQARP